MKYEDRVKLWIRGQRRCKLIGLSSPCGVGGEPRLSRKH